jgi:ABC-type transport system substrate-binding protein
MRRVALAFASLLLAFAAAAEPKVLRYAFEIAETSFDPQRIADVYSQVLNGGIYDTPLTYDYLARPATLKPNVVTAMPEVSADGRTYTFHVKPGIYFSDDPAFNGRKRELVAADFIYGMKRVLDARTRASQIVELESTVVGAREAARKSRETNTFDYDAPIEGLKVVDKYTFQVRLNEPIAVFIYNFSDCRIACAVAREVAEKYGDDFGSHPVGTGPWKLAFWKRSSKIVLERSPTFREEHWDAHPPANDARGQEIAARLRGKRIPLIDRVEVSIIEETQPRWLAFLNGEMDLTWVPEEFSNQAMPNNKLAPNLAKKGIQMEQSPLLDITYLYFNMDDPVWGGYTPEKVALRRAVALTYKTQDEIAIIRKGQAIPAQTPYSPGVTGWDDNFRTSAGENNVPKAKALLDMYGYVDRDGDGYRETPDGRPLVFAFNSTPTARDSQIDELWKRSLDDIGIRFTVSKAKWPDLLKAARQRKLTMWSLGDSASAPDADTWLTLLWSKNEEQNFGNFHLPEYDRLYEKSRVTEDVAERTKLYQQMAKLVVAYVPWKLGVHRIRTEMWWPDVYGFRRHPIYTYNFWKYIDIDPAVQARMGSG